MKEYEYNQELTSQPLLICELNILGEFGWELCSLAILVNIMDTPYYYIFKREK